MGRIVSRRDLLKFVGGTAVGFALSPVPWKLTDDLSIWTQNWSRIPKLPRGSVRELSSHCTLCPASCGVRLRSVPGAAVSVLPQRGHPVSRGVLCPLVFGAHQLPWHPRRMTEPVALRAGRDGRPVATPVALQTVLAAIAGAMTTAGPAGTLAILDPRPGRSVSHVYRRLLAGVERGIHVPVPPLEARSTAALEAAFVERPPILGYDLGKARTIVSFGAPLLEGWGGPGRTSEILSAANRPRIVQVETRPSTTALRADQWLPIRPGTETALALALAHVLLGEGCYDREQHYAADFERFAALVDSFPPERAARITDVPAETIVTLGRSLAGASAVAIGGGDPGGGPLARDQETAIAALNFLVGAVRSDGPIVPRLDLPDPAPGKTRADSVPLDQLPDGSVRVLIIDGAAGGDAIPAALVARKLVPDGRAVVVSLSPWLVGLACTANYVVPAPTWLERTEEASTPPGAPRASFGLSAAVVAPPPLAVDPVAFVHALSRIAGTRSADPSSCDGVIERQVQAIARSGRGRVISFDEKAGAREARPGSAEEFLALLRRGAVWIDDDPRPTRLPSFRLLGPDPASFESAAAAIAAPPADTLPLVLAPYGLRGASGDAPVPVLASKLYRESGLRTGPEVLLIHPATARERGIADGAKVRVETARGSMLLRAALDTRVRRGVVHAAVGPDPWCAGEDGAAPSLTVLDLCAGGSAETWRTTPAAVREA